MGVDGSLTTIVSYKGYVPSNEAGKARPKLAGWSIPQDSSNGPVYPAGYDSPDIICHVGATAPQVSVKVEAGSTVDLVCMECSSSGWRSEKHLCDIISNYDHQNSYTYATS